MLYRCRNSKPVDSYCVSLMIFSGRPDPVWTIQCSTHRQLCEDLKRSPSQPRPPSRLGYKGFRCSPTTSCYATSGFVILGNETKALQHRLLDSAPPDIVVDGLKTRVHEWINSQ